MGKRKRDRRVDPRAEPATGPGAKQQKTIATSAAAAGTAAARVYTCKLCGTASTDAPWFSNHVRECKYKASAGEVVRDGSGKPVLNGVVISISVWQAPTALAAAEGAAVARRAWDEAKVKILLRELGAKHSRNVHKKVKYLIVSDAAVKRNTQSVRKAANKNIPMVLPAFLAACKSEKRHVDAAPFALAQKAVLVKKSEAEKKDAAEAKRDLGSSVLMEHAQTFDLGCCCSCHDSDCWLDMKKPTDCDWCHDVCYAK